MMEILSAMAIIAVLVAVMVPAIGNYVETARKTADKQTLMVLNDALNRYKTQGGDLTALTSGASIGNVLQALKTPVTWAGVSHKFLNEGVTYTVADLGALGEGKRFRFTKYGNYADGSAVGSDILETTSSLGYDVGDEAEFDEWITDAMSEIGSDNYMIFTNPSTTDRIGLFARVASNGDKVRVWWGDGTTENFDSMTSGSNTIISKVYSTSEERTIVVLGNISYIYSSNNAEIGGDGATYFGGDIGNMNSLSSVSIHGSNTLGGDVTNLTDLTILSLASGNTISGDVTNLTNLTYLSLWNNTSITGDVTGLTNLTTLRAYGTNTLSGDVSGMTKLVELIVQGSNTVTGDVSAMENLQTLSIGGNNTIYGDVTGFPLTYVNLTGFSSVDVSSLISVSFSSTGLSTLILGNNNYPLDQTQVDTILGNFWTNRDAAKPRKDRKITLNESNQAVPSATGETYKANLQAYRSPNDDPTKDLWSVSTN